MEATPNPGESINAGLINRLLVVLVVAAYENKWIRKLVWRRTRGIIPAFGLCIKVKRSENLAEAHTMRYVAEHTSIPVPKIHCAFMRKGIAYHVMDDVKGQMAVQGWRKFRSEESKASILHQLRGMVAELRALPLPEGAVVGNIAGGPFFDPRLPKTDFWGPFASIKDFHKALANNIDPTVDYPNTPEDLHRLFEFYREANHPLVLTHGDLSSLNIMVEGDQIVGIVDWETSGWLPSYWEYTTAKYANPFNEFWADEVDKFLDPLPLEWEMETIRRKYFGDY